MIDANPRAAPAQPATQIGERLIGNMGTFLAHTARACDCEFGAGQGQCSQRPRLLEGRRRPDGIGRWVGILSRFLSISQFLY